MQRHWSAIRRSRPHGQLVGVLTAVLQVAPLWEMLDKVLSQGRPRDYDYQRLGGQRQPLLQSESSQTRSSQNTPRSDLPKGSPGENAMRGVRKMSMVNLPQAMLSLWVHAGALVPVDAEPQTQSLWQLGLAFAAAFLCVAFGIADFVLYIWVHDAFVRENKKLVTLHYCVEILSRVPVVVLFHVSYSRSHGYMPTLILFAVDVLLTSVLLLASRMSKPNGWWSTCRCCLAGGITSRGLMQFLYSLVVSVMLFVVNVVYFDPGMIFFYVNQAFYVIKYTELFVMMHLIRVCRNCTDGLVLAPNPKSAFDLFWWGELVFAFVNALFVWVYVPLRRRAKDARLTSSISPGSSSAGGDERAEPPVPGTLGRLSSSAPGRMLEHLEEIFELLSLLSKASCSRNRSRLLNVTVGELWLQALRWNSEYDDGRGGVLQIKTHGSQCAVVQRQAGNGSKAAAEARAFAKLDGPCIVLGERRGVFDCVHVRWDDGEVWTRRGDSQGLQREQAHEVLGLILPQLAMALRWDTPGSHDEGLGLALDCAAAGSAAASSATATAGDAADFDLEAGDLGSGASTGSSGCGPLLSFLIRYGLMTRQAEFISELYWALFCLSHDEGRSGSLQERRGALEHAAASTGEPEHQPHGYRAARLALLHELRGRPRGPQASAGEGQEFRRNVRRLLRGQRELWRQKMYLLAHLGHRGASAAPASAGGGSSGSRAGSGATGSGAWYQRTEDLRDALRRWPHLRRRLKLRTSCAEDEDEQLLRSPRDVRDEDEQLLQSPRKEQRPASPGALDSGGGVAADLVSPEGSLYLPIDPAVPFCGVIAEESEVMPSKWAPVLFSCRTSSSLDRGAETNTTRAKYLLKVGDDLRQDQLMLQIMALMGYVWQERLSPSDARLLQLAKFRVLAVTPQSGYVKFVPDAVPLSEALHQSQGNLVSWLDRNRKQDMPLDKVLDNLCGSVAASCVVTYILGIGDRHLENLCLTRQGQFFHIDFSFVLGDDPKPCAPQVRLPQQVAQALHATDRLGQCFGLAARAYKELRPFAGLWGSVLQLTASAGGAGCSKLMREPLAAVAGVRERLRVDQGHEELAASEFLCLVRESSEGLASILMDKVHAAGLFWR